MPSVKPKPRSILWPLRILVVASLVGPALFFGYTAWTNYRGIKRQSKERIERTLDVVQEHTLKAFQTVERTIAETNEVLRDLSDDQIREQETRLQRRLRLTQDALPQIEAIWVFDRSGHPLLSSTILPVPRDLDNSDRDYFKVQADHDAGPFIGSTITAKIGGARFFVISQRRPGPEGTFDGVVAVSVRPEHFHDFYALISWDVADLIGMIRADGAFLARYPSLGTAPVQLTAQSDFMRAIRKHPDAGLFTAVSQVDSIERRVGYRRVPGYPIYVEVGIQRAALWRELRATMQGHLAFGAPATVILFCLSLYALHRTRDFYLEVDRRETAEAALKQAQRLETVGHLTGGVAHDFNNLLMVVKGNVDRLRRYPADERQKRALDAIETAATRGANLTRQLLSFSRKQTHAPVVIDLSQHLPGLQDMLRSSLRGDIAVDVRLQNDLWNTKVDPSELELAVLNVAVNARDAMPDGGLLTIAGQNVAHADAQTIGIQGDFVALSLSDTGSGIPAGLLPHVFEPFFTTKEVGKGTGLGLSQVYGFARQSGGMATAASEPGKGTTITLYLPRSDENAADQDAPKVSPVRCDGQGHILLVEDNHDIAEITRSNLEELGYQVTHASDAQAALAILTRPASAGQAEHFDLVFSDIVMPGDMNGVDLARTIRHRAPGLPILLATGYSAMAQAAMDEGFPILRKPYDAADLSSGIRRATNGPYSHLSA